MPREGLLRDPPKACRADACHRAHPPDQETVHLAAALALGAFRAVARSGAVDRDRLAALLAADHLASPAPPLVGADRPAAACPVEDEHHQAQRHQEPRRPPPACLGEAACQAVRLRVDAEVSACRQSEQVPPADVDHQQARQDGAASCLGASPPPAYRADERLAAHSAAVQDEVVAQEEQYREEPFRGGGDRAEHFQVRVLAAGPCQAAYQVEAAFLMVRRDHQQRPARQVEVDLESLQVAAPLRLAHWEVSQRLGRRHPGAPIQAPESAL